MKVCHTDVVLRAGEKCYSVIDVSFPFEINAT